MKTRIIKNDTEGYGYHYASLSNIAEQDVEIPLMQTRLIEGHEYIYYLDEELNEWLQGARVVIPEAKGMNEAQRYASAITYARRVTTQLAKRIACRDDEDIENTDSQGNQKQELKATDKQVEFLTKLYSIADINKILEHYKVESCKDLPMSVVSQYIDNAQKRNKERNAK